ncbi:hypothetical protein BH23ACT11_BH23ACT11_04480 [soil metagenome]
MARPGHNSSNKTSGLDAATPTVSRGRKAVFWAITLALPLLFFALLEGGLRLANYGNDYPLFEPVQQFDGWQVQSRDVARRYFANQVAVPTALEDFFRVQKPGDGIRIVVQGGSTAAGYPYYFGGAFSRMLATRIQQTFPERQVEVVNTAMAAVNSYTLLDLADGITAIRPDAVLIYAGHNEYYGALGAASSETLGPTRLLVTWYLKLRHFRTVQLTRDFLARLAPGATGTPTGPPDGTLMARMIGNDQVALGSSTYRLGERQFESNLDALLAHYQRARIPVFVATLASNERDHSPFVSIWASEEQPGTMRAAINSALQRAEAGDTRAAIDGLERLLASDTLSAEIPYRLGHLYLADGRSDDARRAFILARDRDALRFRAPSSFNGIIRRVAARRGAAVVEVEQAFRSASPQGIIGNGLMLEHLHPNLEGYFLMADAFFESLRFQGLFGDWSGAPTLAEARSERLVTEIDSIVGTLRVRRLMSTWPFLPRGRTGARQDTLTARTAADSLALAFYRNEMTWAQATAELADRYERAARLPAALRLRFALIQSLPLVAEPYFAAGNTLAQIGRSTSNDAYLREAMHYYGAALDLDSTLAHVHGIAGSVALELGDHEAALTHLTTARRLQPQRAQWAYNLAGARLAQGRLADARRLLAETLQIEPDHAAAEALLVRIGN